MSLNSSALYQWQLSLLNSIRNFLGMYPLCDFEYGDVYHFHVEYASISRHNDLKSNLISSGDIEKSMSDAEKYSVLLSVIIRNGSFGCIIVPPNIVAVVLDGNSNVFPVLEFMN